MSLPQYGNISPDEHYYYAATRVATIDEVDTLSGARSNLQVQIDTKAENFGAGTWNAHDARRSWVSICASADGAKLAAAELGGQIYTSTDSGATWTARESARLWQAIACSSDGTKLVASVQGGQLYTSTDSGVNWTARDSDRDWYRPLASSGDGFTLVAGVNAENLYRSVDSGASWSAVDSARAWEAVSASSDGTKWLAVVNGGQVYISTDSGATWAAKDSSRAWQCACMASDASVMYAGIGGAGELFKSADGGNTWSALGFGHTAYGMSCSADGSVVIVATGGGTGRIYLSKDSGASWVAIGEPGFWTATACSSDGTVYAAVGDGEFIVTGGTVLYIDSVDGAGTDYSLTNSYARVDFGTIDAQVTLPGEGVYRVTAQIALTNGATDGDVYKFKLYDSTGAADIAGSERTIRGGSASDQRQVVLDRLIPVTAETVIQIYGYNATAARGTVIAAEASIIYERRY